MIKKFLFVLILSFASLFLTGCQKKVPGNPIVPPPQIREEVPDNIKDGTDADGFVRFPGEPTREDKSYYIIEDICGQFTQKFMEGITGLSFVKIEPFSGDSTYGCQYYTSTKEEGGVDSFFSISLDYLEVADQKKGHEMLGRKIITEPKINMEPFIIVQQASLINEIYLVLAPNKFLSINRSSGKVLSEAQDLELAIKLAEKIKNFK